MVKGVKRSTAPDETKASIEQKDRRHAVSMMLSGALIFLSTRLNWAEPLVSKVGLYELPNFNVVAIGLLFGVAVAAFNGLVVTWLKRFEKLTPYRPYFNPLVPILGAFLIPVTEEIVYRGYAQQVFNVWWATLLFAIAHAGKYQWKNVVFSKAPSGLVFGYALVITNNIWAPIIAHAVNNITHIGWTFRYNRRLAAAVKLNLQGKYKEALPLFDACINEKPLAYVFRNRGLANHELKNKDQALADYNQALALGDNFAYILRAQYYSNIMEDERAVEDARKAIASGSNSLFAFRTAGWAELYFGNFAVALSHFESAYKSSKSALDVISRGAAYFSLSEFEECVADYGLAISSGFPAVLPLLSRGVAYLSMNEIEKARVDFEDALKNATSAQMATVLRYRSYLNLKIDQFERGLADCEQSLELEPDIAATLMPQVCCLIALERLDDASTVLAKALEKPAHRVERIRMECVKSVLLVCLGQISEAQVLARGCVEQLAEQPMEIVVFGITLMFAGKFTEAVEQFSKAIDRDKHFLLAYHYREKAYSKLNQPEKAAADRATLGQHKYSSWRLVDQRLEEAWGNNYIDK